LVLAAAAYGAGLAIFLPHGTLQDTPVRATLAWEVTVAFWLLGLPPIWLIARFEARCMARRMQAHFSQTIVRQHRFVTDAAHELRTPLTAQAVIGESALTRKATRAELREAVGSMLEESKHMRRLIDSLLELTRVSAEGVVEKMPRRKARPLDLGRLSHKCVESLQILAEEKQQTLRLVGACDVWVDADVTIVRQAVLNVIHNAIEHCPQGACIQVETLVLSPTQGAIRVTDDGPGIALEEQSRVFERFYRGPASARRRGGGLGLGLAIARAVMQSQRGDIRLVSRPGAGCCFTLTLPMLPERSGRLRRSQPPPVAAGFKAPESRDGCYVTTR
jgi:signal transduction histidine kinase